MDKKKYLFKFMPFNKYSLLALIKRSLYFSNPNLLNDPIDCIHNIKIRNLEKMTVVDIIKLVGENRSLITWDKRKSNTELANLCLEDHQYLLSIIIHLIREHNKSKIGICSFTTECKDQLLWSHYADSSNGICLIFDQSVLVSKINLNSNRQDSNLRRYYGGLVDYIGDPYEIEIVNNKFDIEYKYYLKKTQSWVKEKEYRLILEADGGMQDYSKYEKNRYLLLPENALIGIILGEKTTNYEYTTFCDLCPKLGYNIFIEKATRDIGTGKLTIPFD